MRHRDSRTVNPSKLGTSLAIQEKRLEYHRLKCDQGWAGDLWFASTTDQQITQTRLRVVDLHYWEAPL
jgi:hypothetical protein